MKVSKIFLKVEEKVRAAVVGATKGEEGALKRKVEESLWLTMEAL